MVILILFVDCEKINYNAWFFQKKMFKFFWSQRGIANN